MIFEKMTPTEVNAVNALRTYAIGSSVIRSAWTKEENFPVVNEASSGSVELHATIGQVQKRLAQALKPGRKLVSVVRFTDGTMEEVSTAVTPKDDAAPQSPHRAPGEASEPASFVAAADPPPATATEKKPKAAVTVAQPTLGCPMPDFERAEHRATRVLETFLDPGQLEDFRATQSFVSEGAESGHRYLIVSRNAGKVMRARTGGWQLYDLDEERSLCVHDWTLPAPEEMLTLHLFLKTSGNEGYLRQLH